MRVALVAPPWMPVPPPGYGGTERVIDLLARGLSEAGHDVVLFATGDSTCPVELRSLFERGQETRHIGLAAPELRHTVAAYRDPAVLAADVIHDHTLVGPIHATRFPGLRLVTTVHNWFDDGMAEVYRDTAERIPLVAVSHAQRATAPGVAVARVVHHGVDPRDYPAGAGRGGYCVYLGRMASFKGPHFAIDAAARAGMPIVLAGEPRGHSDAVFFEREVVPRLGPDARYVGEVDHPAKVALLGDAAALLFPIRWSEPFGMVMLEALACGTPVIAFREGSAPEVVDDGRTGFLCRDETEMADCLLRIGTIERAACRAAVERGFSMARMADDYVEVYESLLR